MAHCYLRFSKWWMKAQTIANVRALRAKKLFLVWGKKSWRVISLILSWWNAHTLCVCVFGIIVIIINEHNEHKKKFHIYHKCGIGMLTNYHRADCVFAFVEISCRHLATRNNSLNIAWWIFIGGVHKIFRNCSLAWKCIHNCLLSWMLSSNARVCVFVSINFILRSRWNCAL